ncbi:MAG: DUF1570 domain-containing protein [Planctomycetes bacterium]|nr:DUF1570 domain-containing protein [Planctomycetota bacterium]
MSPRLLACLTLLVLPLFGGGEAAEVAHARASADAGDWAAARALLDDYVARSAGDADAQELLGRALLALDEPDLAAHHLARALALLEAAGETKRAKLVLRDLGKADALQGRRARLFRDATSKLWQAARRLNEDGHAERALALLEGLAPAATGKDAPRVRALLAELRAAHEEVDLDAAGSDAGEPGAWPLVTYEGAHYVVAANLEPDLARLVADTMDDIHGYYVQLYFDGDVDAAKSEKATIRVHPTRDAMLAGWRGGEAPEGWWSPGENRVTCYDTRTTTGSLDWMLETLFHEASHQFMTLLGRRGGWAPAWLNEGTASFFEGATAMADHRVLWPDAALGRLQNLAAALQSGSDEVTLAKVVGFEGGGSYPASYYAWGWGLVYFLQQYEDPETLEYVYRPLYARYREAITSRGGDARALFDEVFLGKGSPRGHARFEDFDRDWRAWILGEVRPLHFAPQRERRALRMARVARYLAAADAAATEKHPRVAREDLLRRALGHVEYVRSVLDGEDAPDVEVIALQARLFEDLGQPQSAAPLVELQLELADEGVWEPDEATYAALEKHLAELDRKNYALRRAVSTRRGLARGALRLVRDYREAEPALPLRAYTFAAEMSAALDDDELRAAAAELRAEVRAAGLLRGEVSSLVAPRAAWETIYSAEADEFTLAPGFLGLEAVRPAAYVNTALELGDEYELRATFRRDGTQHRSTVQGLVVAGVRDGDWLVFGLLTEGQAGLWRLALSRGGGVVTRKIESFQLDPPPADDADLAVRAHVSDGRTLRVEVAGCAPLETTLPDDLPTGRFAGLYVKDGATRLVDPVVERYP